MADSSKKPKKKEGTLDKVSAPATSIDELVQRVISYSNSTNGKLYNSINQDFLLSLMDKSKIIEIEKSFPPKGLDIIDFVRLMLNSISHRDDETLYLAMALVELFKRISENLNLVNTIHMKHITSIICDQNQEKNNAQYKIQTVLLPEPQRFKLDPTKIRSIDINPPPLYGRYDEDLQRLAKQKIKTDSMHHLNHRIKTGVYAKDFKTIISLDSLSDRINMYDLNCEFKQFVRPKSNLDTEESAISSDVIIFSFAWSERQQRLGATLKDFTLCFWDKSDNFKYEKQIAIQSIMSDYQTNIWYLEFPNCWLTTDSKNKLYEWDLERENIKRTFSSPKIKHTIFDVVEITQLKLVAVGSSDRLVTIWDFANSNLVQTIEFLKAGIHSMKYFENYSVLICGGFQNNISIHQINPLYLDVNLKGNLVGHQSMITAIDCIEKTPMVISSDDSGTIKLWDIRTMKCIQTVDCGQRTVITKIINIYKEGKLCFLGTRINIVDFDESDAIAKKSNSQDDLFPIKVETTKDRLIVVTRKDIRFINVDTGKIEQIFVGLLNDEEDEITAFKQIEQGSKFILGNHRGEISLHNVQNGELIQKMPSHSNEVTSIRIDYFNKLMISGGRDSNIKIQYLGVQGGELKREITNCFFNKEITFLEVSVYHNLLFAASNTETIYVFDYEFAKLISAIHLEKKAEVQTMQVVNGFSLFFISTTQGFIHILSFTKKEFVFTYKLIGSIDISHLLEFHLPSHNDVDFPCNFLPLDKNDSEATPNNLPVIQLLQATIPHRTSLAQVKLTRFGNENDSATPSIHQNTPQSKAKGDSKNIRGFSQMVQNQNVEKSMKTFASLEHSELHTERDEEREEDKQNKIFANRILVECVLKENEEENNKIDKLNIFCCLNKGDIFGLNLVPFCSQFDFIQYTDHCNKRINYNAYRSCNENFLKGILQIKVDHQRVGKLSRLNIEGRKCSESQLHKVIYKNLIFHKPNAHRDLVTSMMLIKLDGNYLLTSSMDSYIKLWDQQTGELKASKNVNHPLPIVWKIQKDMIQDGKKRIIYALKILDVITKKYEKELSLSEAHRLRVNDFMAHVVLWNELGENEFDKELGKEVLLMKDEYQARDLKYEQSKHFYQSELRGPSLKRMEANKRVALATKAWQQETKSKEEDLENKLRDDNQMIKNYKFEEREELVLFLQENYREKITSSEFLKVKEEFTKPTLDLMKKMDATVFFNRKKKERKDSILTKSSQNQLYRSQGTKTLIEVYQIKKSEEKKTTMKSQMSNSSKEQHLQQQERLPQIDKPSSVKNSSQAVIPLQLAKRKSCQNLYNYAEKKNLISSEGQSLFTNKVNYPTFRSKPNQSYHGGSYLLPPNASFIQTVENQIGGDSLFQDIQLHDQINPIPIHNENEKVLPTLNNSILTQMCNNQINNIDFLTNDNSIEKVNNTSITSMNNNTNNNALNINQTGIINASLNNNNNTTAGSFIESSKQFSIEEQQQQLLDPKSVFNNNNKLTNLLKSMDLKVKKSQHSFTDGLLETNFLKQRKSMGQFDILSRHSSKVIGGGGEDDTIKLKQVIPKTEISQNYDQFSHPKSSNLNKSNFQMKKDHSSLSVAGLETLKQVLYGQSKLNNATIPKSSNNKYLSTSQSMQQNQFFDFNIDRQQNLSKKTQDIKPNQEKNQSQQEAEALLASMHNSVFDNPDDVLRRHQMRKQLTTHLVNAYSIFSNIQEAMNSPTHKQNQQLSISSLQKSTAGNKQSK